MHTYFPDFIVRDKIYEIKGYVKEVDKIKFSSVPGLVVITGDRMNRYLNYVIQKYGDNFTYLYDKSYNRLSKKDINIKKPKEVVKDHRWSDYEKKRLEFIKTRFLEIINSDVDFTRFGWVSEVSNQNNYNGFRTKMIKWLHMYAPSFLDWCYVYDRDRHHEYDGINKAL